MEPSQENLYITQRIYDGLERSLYDKKCKSEILFIRKNRGVALFLTVYRPHQGTGLPNLKLIN